MIDTIKADNFEEFIEKSKERFEGTIFEEIVEIYQYEEEKDFKSVTQFLIQNDEIVPRIFLGDFKDIFKVLYQPYGEELGTAITNSDLITEEDFGTFMKTFESILSDLMEENTEDWKELRQEIANVIPSMTEEEFERRFLSTLDTEFDALESRIEDIGEDEREEMFEEDFRQTVIMRSQTRGFSQVMLLAQLTD